jgi:YggT family protein
MGEPWVPPCRTRRRNRAVQPELASMGVINAGLVLDAVTSVQNFLEVFIYLYIFLILAYVISSWIRLPYSPWLNRIQRFLYDVCDPYLRLFRRILPPLGPLDLSPMVAVIVLIVIDQVVVRGLLDRLH